MATTDLEAQMGMMASDLEGLIELSREHTRQSGRLREALEQVLLCYARGKVQEAQHKANGALAAFSAWVKDNEETGAGQLAGLADARRRKPQPDEG